MNINMKIIDIFKIIADGGEPPKKIRVGNDIYKFDDELKIYMNDNGFDFMPNLCKLNPIKEFINCEVEVIEEDNEIKKIERQECVDFADTLEKTLDKLDEIIEVVNELKNKEE